MSLATLAVIGVGQMERAVACVTFSRADGGSLLACVDEGPDHTISVWEWQRPDKGHCLAETKVILSTLTLQLYMDDLVLSAVAYNSSCL